MPPSQNPKIFMPPHHNSTARSSRLNGTHSRETRFPPPSSHWGQPGETNAIEMQSSANMLPPHHVDRDCHRHTSATNDQEHHEDTSTADNNNNQCTNCASLLKRVTRLEAQSEIATQLFAQLIESRSQQPNNNNDNDNSPSSSDVNAVLTPPATTTTTNPHLPPGYSSRSEAPPTFDDLQEFYDFLKGELHNVTDKFSQRIDDSVEPVATLRRDVDSLFAWHQSVVEAEDRRTQEKARVKPEKTIRMAYTDRWKVDFRPPLSGSNEETSISIET